MEKEEAVAHQSNANMDMKANGAEITVKKSVEIAAKESAKTNWL